MTPRAPNERGIALPAVIFLVALLTLLLTSGLSRVQADRQIAEAGEATADAFAIAQSGLQHYLGTRTARPPDGDSVRINLTGGYANVISRIVRNPADTTENSLYLVRSTGFVIDPVSGSTIQAQRSVAQFADWQTGSIEAKAALTAANGIRRDPPSAANNRNISGFDLCGGAPIIGAIVDSIWGTPGGAVTFDGSPTNTVIRGTGASQAIANETEIDWAGVLSSSFTPDYTSFQNGDISGFSIQRVFGNLTLSTGGRGSGILIVRDNLEINGTGFYFNGIIMAGGEIDFFADTVLIRGLVFSGLNEQLGTPVSLRDDIDSDDNVWLEIDFDSCKVDSALAALTGMAPVANAWLDSWARY